MKSSPSPKNRPFGPYNWGWLTLIFCNFLAIQPLWWKSVRQSTTWLWIISFIVSIGMWFERFVIVIMSLHRDFLPSSWDRYRATIWDYALFAGHHRCVLQPDVPFHPLRADDPDVGAEDPAA